MPKDQPASFEITSSEVVFAGKIWDVARETFDYKGTSLTREFVKHTGAVAVIALDDQQRVLMIRQYRHPVREYLWEIPAGLLDIPGEPKIEAAKRELLEESGYVAAEWSHLLDFATTPGGNDEIISIYLAQSLELRGHDLTLEGEEVDLLVEWVPLREAIQSALKSEIKSPSAVVGILALGNLLAQGELRSSDPDAVSDR